MSTTTAFRFAVNVSPKPGILDPQGRAVEGSLTHLGVSGVSAVRVGRRVELTVEAASYAVELIGATSATASPPTGSSSPDGAVAR